MRFRESRHDRRDEGPRILMRGVERGDDLPVLVSIHRGHERHERHERPHGHERHEMAEHGHGYHHRWGHHHGGDAVPEPATAMLLATGLLMLAVAGKKRGTNK